MEGGDTCAGGLEGMGVMLSGIDSSPAGLTLIATEFSGDNDSTSIPGVDAGISPEAGAEDRSGKWKLGGACEGPTSSAMDSSESDRRSIVVDMVDFLAGNQSARKYRNDLLALEAMRSICLWQCLSINI